MNHRLCDCFSSYRSFFFKNLIFHTVLWPPNRSIFVYFFIRYGQKAAKVLQIAAKMERPFLIMFENMFVNLPSAIFAVKNKVFEEQ